MQKSIGSVSESAYPTILAKGYKLCSFNFSSDIKINEQPASSNFEELPAVIVPLFEKAGLNNGIFSLIYFLCSSSSVNISFSLSDNYQG